MLEQESGQDPSINEQKLAPKRHFHPLYLRAEIQATTFISKRATILLKIEVASQRNVPDTTK